MDPNENLRRQLEIAREIVRLSDAPGDACEYDVNRRIAELAGDPGGLAELVQSLDQWIGRGGFLPAAWARRSGPVSGEP